MLLYASVGLFLACADNNDDDDGSIDCMESQVKQQNQTVEDVGIHVSDSDTVCRLKYALAISYEVLVILNC